MSKEAKDKKYVYFFGGKKADGKADMKTLLGGKGANLAEMVSMGLPIPPGFTISTESCDLYYKNDKTNSQQVLAEIEQKLQKLEKQTGKKL